MSAHPVEFAVSDAILGIVFELRWIKANGFARNPPGQETPCDVNQIRPTTGEALREMFAGFYTRQDSGAHRSKITPQISPLDAAERLPIELFRTTVGAVRCGQLEMSILRPQHAKHLGPAPDSQLPHDVSSMRVDGL